MVIEMTTYRMYRYGEYETIEVENTSGEAHYDIEQYDKENGTDLCE